MRVGHAEFPARADDYGPAVRMFLELAGATPTDEYARTHLLRLRFAGELERLFERVDIFACPTLGVRAPAGLSVLDPVVAQLMGKLMRFAAPFDFSGSPTISLRGLLPTAYRQPAARRTTLRMTLVRAAAAWKRRPSARAPVT
jgi:amidase